MVDRNPWINILSHAVLILGVAIVAFPLYLALVASTHTSSEIVQAPMPLLPGTHLWENYRNALLGSGKLGSNTNVLHMMWVAPSCRSRPRTPPSTPCMPNGAGSTPPRPIASTPRAPPAAD